ncbi:MAG: SPOR domain-containing protein [Xanthobacteraceae bacterium]|nr:SPOR domain-containing protein [Xanthobacteraceae bacterium]
MFGAKSASNRGARYILIGLAIVSAAVICTTDSADARRRHHYRHRSHAERSSYAPAFSSIIVDGNSGATLQANSADSPRHPASLTKIMTLYLLFEKLDSGKLKLDSMLDVSERASDQAPTKLGLRPGQSIRVEDAIKGIVTRSANDAAVVVAEAIGGSEDDFAKLMTRKARALGMSRTTYVNASGLPDEDQITTARDQSTLGRAIQDRFPKYYRYFSTEAFNWRGTSIRNHNRLLGHVEGVDGIKTGYTRSSGFNLVTSMRRGNRFLVGVVMGGRSGGSRDAIMRNLLAEHLDEGSTKRTVAAITERNAGDTRVASADADDASAAQTRAPAPAAPRPAPTTTQVQGAIQSAPATAKPMPLPQNEPAPQGQQNPVPAPLTSGVIASQLATAPGSAEPMTPVRVKTVQVRMNGTKLAVAAAPKTLAPAATSAIPVREDTAEAQRAPMRAVDTPRVVSANPPFPAPIPIVVTHNSPGMGQGTVGNAPGSIPTSSASMPHANTLAYADRGAPPTTLAAQAQAMESSVPVQRMAAVSPQPEITQQNGAIKATPRSGWIIQVGALESEGEALQRLDAARGSAGKLLGRADQFTETVAKGNKTLYRARFAGLDQDSAEAVCRTLKRSDISCIAIKN